MSKAVFYHAGCPVCLNAERMVLDSIASDRISIESVHLGEQANRIAEAEALGVNTVPALLLNGQVFHINFGAKLADLKA